MIDNPNPFEKYIVDRTEINRVSGICIFIAFVLVAVLIGVLLP